MKRILFTMLLAASLSAEAQTQTYETEFARPLNEVLTDWHLSIINLLSRKEICIS